MAPAGVYSRLCSGDSVFLRLFAGYRLLYLFKKIIFLLFDLLMYVVRSLSLKKYGADISPCNTLASVEEVDVSIT